MQIRVGIKGIRELERRAGTNVQRLRQELKAVSGQHAQTLAVVIRAAAPKDTGALASSILWSFKRKNSLGATLRVGARLTYAKLIEYGTKKQRIPPWRPGSNIEKWATKHGLNPFMVARAVAFRGNKARPFVWPAVNADQPRFQMDVEAVVRRVITS